MSFFNVVTLFLFMITITFLLKQKEVGAIKILNIITLRTVINPGLAVGIENLQILKWLIIFLCTGWLIFSYRLLSFRQKAHINKLLLPVILYGIYTIFSSLFFSTLPTVAIFKLISYILPFISIIIGISATSTYFNWMEWLNKLFSIIVLISLPLIFIPIGFITTGEGFQGITNQPNMFGILLTLYISLLLTRYSTNPDMNNFFTSVMLLISFCLIILTQSRTGLLSSLVIISIYLSFSKINLLNKALYFSLFIAIFLIFIIITDGKIFSPLINFIYKGQDNILASREGQIQGVLQGFYNKPLFGSGFSVPVTNYRTFSFLTNAVVEPGNIILAVLSYGGIIGFLLFSNYLIILLLGNKKNIKKLIYIYISPLLISMGEMVFFSTNNIGIWCYTFLAIYYSYNRNN